MTHSPDRLESSFQAAFADVMAPRPDDAARLEAMVAEASTVVAPSSPATSSLGKSLLGIGVGVVAVGLVVALWPAAPEPAPSTPAVAGAPVPAHVLDEPPELDDAAAEPPQVPAIEPIAPAEVDEAPEPAPAVALDPVPTTRRRAVAENVPEPEATAGELLARANSARREGAFAAADRDFVQLQRRFPQSREAVLARVTHGRLLLDELDRAEDALAQFSAYLDARPKGTLAEEAMVGRARALERLGRSADADAAWRAVADRFPDSVHAER